MFYKQPSKEKDIERSVILQKSNPNTFIFNVIAITHARENFPHISLVILFAVHIPVDKNPEESARGNRTKDTDFSRC